MEKNLLFYGDNLDVLRREIPNESVDLIYLDPPFNSNRSYNVLFAHKSGEEAQAQIEAFDDTWTWSPESDEQYRALVEGGAPPKVADAIEAMRRLLGENDVLAYLVMMTARLVELHRVLKSTGSLYLHCDPTASHYLKVLLDAIFGPNRFKNEIIWKRTSAHSDVVQGARHVGRIHDVILYYSKSDNPTWNTQYLPYSQEYIERTYRYVDEDGRRYQTQPLHAKQPGGDTRYEWKGQMPPDGRYWAFSRENMEKLDAEGRIYYSRTGVPRYKIYLDESLGRPLQDIWDDIPPVHTSPSERLGYPTQKPEALLERILRVSSDEGQLVLDPFCGCGTTVAVAQRLRRSWIGVDITFLAVDLIKRRLEAAYGNAVHETFEVLGIPRDVEGARALFQADPFDFERWAVHLVDGQPNLRQVGDQGADGVIRFPLDGRKAIGRVLVSVKGGGRLNPAMVRDLVGTVASQGAEMGLLVTLEGPTRGMVDAAHRAGTFTWELTGKAYPKVQVVTVAQLLSGERPELPSAFNPYVKAPQVAAEQRALFET